MRIESTELANLRTFASANYKTPTGLSLVTGQNGTGKSTLMLAVAWAIWGQTPGRSQDFLVRHGEREMSATVQFSSQGQRYLVRRQFRLNKEGKGGVTQLIFNSVEVAGIRHDLTEATVKETQAQITAVAGTFEVWQMTAYVGQREGAGQFLEAKAYERKGILRDIIAGAGNWDEWEAIAKKWVASHETQINRIEGAIPVLIEAAEPLDAVNQMLTAARLLGVEADIALTKSTNNLENSNVAVEQGREVVAAWKDRDGKLAAAQIQAAIYKASISKIDANIAELQKSAEQLDHVNAEIKAQQGKIAERQIEIDAVMAANESCTLADTEALAAYETAMENWRAEHGVWIAKRDTRMNEISDRFAILKKVKLAKESVKANYCPECKQPLTEEHSEELLNLIAENPDWESEMAELNTEYGDLASVKPPQAPEATQLYGLEPIPQQLSQDEKTFELRAKAENANELIQALELEKDTLTSEASGNDSYITDMKQWIETTKRPDANYLEDLLTDNRQALQDERVSHEAKNTQRVNIALAEQAIKAAQSAAEELQSNRESLGNHKTEKHEWETVVLMTGTNGIRQLIIDQALAQLEPACNRWLGIIAPGFEIAFSTQTDTDRETFDEGIIMPSGAIQPWSELSGAQSVAVALAVRLGLAEVGGAAQGIHYETLYLDEADAWLTGIYQQQFMDMLSKVADTGIDVVAITHIDAVKQMVDQQVEVVATGDGTSRLK
jgi:DNA repair exonuclease SbcCD ATPase subunit